MLKRIILSCVFLGVFCAGPPISATDLGVPSYWGDSGAYDTIPEGAIALINPSNGILHVSGEKLDISPLAAQYRSVVTNMAERGVDVYAYVPTGYFNHECDVYAECQSWTRIVTQIYAYIELYPELKGVFFDEAAPSADGKTCADYDLEYARLRGLVHRYKEDFNIIFNPGWSTPCAVGAAKPGEIVMNFEGSLESYYEAKDDISDVSAQANARGVHTWHLVYSVPDETQLKQVFKQAKSIGAGYFYATHIGGNWRAGENTWGSPPSFWSAEKALFQD